jgi:formylglycine-generating enzyme required for sulfatase activity
MKYSPLLLLIIYYILLGSTHAHELPGGKKLIKDYVFIPEGSEGDSAVSEFYISAIEVTNRQYRDFINDLIDSGFTDQARIASVDTLAWGRVIPYCMPFVHYYYQNRAYDDYPVVNISRPAAELYCKWLTKKYNSSEKVKAQFALPTEIQWEYAAQGGNGKSIYPWPGNSITYQRKGRFHGTNMCNYLMDSTRNSSAFHKQNDTADITAPSLSFMPNTFDIYNMGGNVAEMLSDQDYTKGGSYLSHAPKVLISSHEDADLTHGSPYIGFRPVMVMER